jgi:hypothetical protein
MHNALKTADTICHEDRIAIIKALSKGDDCDGKYKPVVAKLIAANLFAYAQTKTEQGCGIIATGTNIDSNPVYTFAFGEGNNDYKYYYKEKDAIKWGGVRTELFVVKELESWKVIQLISLLENMVPDPQYFLSKFSI